MCRVKHGQRGLALVLALWLLTLLTILAAGYGYAMRTETRLTIYGVELARARAIAEAGVWLALADLLRPDPERQRLVDGTLYQFDFGEGQIRLRVQDESGKIDLNSAHDILLRALLEKAAEPGEDVDYVLNAILDWRDPDSQRRNPGAEDSDYAHAGYDAKDAPFNSIEELRLVAGMTDDLFTRIYPTLTLHSRQSGIHPLAAPRAVLMALPDGDGEQMEAFIQNRHNQETLGAPPPNMDARFFGGARGTAFNITSEGITGRSKLKLDVVITLIHGSRLPYSVLSWRESKPVYDEAQAGDHDHGIHADRS